MGRPRVLAGAAACAAVILAGSVLGGCSTTNPDYDPSRPHHRPGGFVNSDGRTASKGLGAFLSWQWERLTARDDGDAGDGARRAFPVQPVDTEWLAANRDRPSVTWIGHSTLLVRMAGLNVLTDPQWSERASPLSWLGPRRYTPVPVALKSLPRIDVVLISHDHYDHLDAPTIRRLIAQPGGEPVFLAPLGVDRWLRDEGARRVERFDWWDGRRVAGALDVHLVPAHHWGARTPFDRNTRLWGGWVLQAPGFSFFFAGDTGWSGEFAEIGRRFGPFDLAAIPIGAYEPRWFMAEQHVDPAEAVAIHRAVRARRSVGIHWGTFQLADEPPDEPPADLARALGDGGPLDGAFFLLRHGETRVLD